MSIFSGPLFRQCICGAGVVAGDPEARCWSCTTEALKAEVVRLRAENQRIQGSNRLVEVFLERCKRELREAREARELIRQDRDRLSGEVEAQKERLKEVQRELGAYRIQELSQEPGGPPPPPQDRGQAMSKRGRDTVTLEELQMAQELLHRASGRIQGRKGRIQELRGLLEEAGDCLNRMDAYPTLCEKIRDLLAESDR